MRKVVSTITGATARIGDEFTLPGGLRCTISEFTGTYLLAVTQQSPTRVALPMSSIGLEWVETDGKSPWERMTSDDWVHAAGKMSTEGGHFASSLAKAYVHADSSNRPPIKASYGHLFFRFLSHERQDELRRED